MESYNWKILENKIDSEASKAERRIYWILIAAISIACIMLTVDNLKLRDKINYDKHEHEYSVHKGLENDVR